MEKISIVWFRNDLRIKDQVALAEAVEKSDKVFPVYCFDEQWFALTELDFPKTGAFRTKFLIESVTDLRNQLQEAGSNLIVRSGKPEEIIPILVQELGATDVYSSKETGTEEEEVEEKLEAELFKVKVSLHLIGQSTLLHVDDIPWPVKNMPDIFTQFRKEAEQETSVRPTVKLPDFTHNAIDEKIDVGTIPAMADFGFDHSRQVDQRTALSFAGGEASGLERLHHYLWDSKAISSYKETRNGLVGEDYSSKFSPWLAAGCLSPRTIYEEIKKYEQEYEKNDSTYWLIFELLWRDFFKFISRKYGRRLFLKGGIKNKDVTLHDDMESFEKWKKGETGVPFIDANMREINLTGYMSNRGRQNVASFLINDLGVNWTWGASYFESKLIDYDVASNWGNWNYLAGVGNDPRNGRYFNIQSQAFRYDPQGDYVRKWIPELADIPGKKIHFPKTEVATKKAYPKPIVSFDKWVY